MPLFLSVYHGFKSDYYDSNSVGPEQTSLNNKAVPGFCGDEYKIEISGWKVDTDLYIYSRPWQKNNEHLQCKLLQGKTCMI